MLLALGGGGNQPDLDSASVDRQGRRRAGMMTDTLK